jgi:hypothetical protein
MTAGMNVKVKTIAEGAHDPILLVDFVRFSAAGTLSQTLAAGGSGRTVHRIDAVSDLILNPDFRPLREIATAYGDALAASGETPALVVGYCSASRLALHIGQYLAECHKAVSVVLVEPSWPSQASIAADLRNMRSSVRGEDVALPVLPATSPAGQLEFMSNLLHGDLRLLAAAQEIPDEEADAFTEEMLGRYRAWMAFVLATAAASPSPAPDHVIVSTAGLTEPVESWTSGSPHVIQLPATPDELFTDDIVCRHLVSILDDVSAT